MTSQEANTKKRMTQVEKQRAAHAKKVSEAEKKWQENNELTPVVVVNHEANQLNNEMSQVNGLGVIERNPQPPAVVNVAQNIVDNGNLHVIQNNQHQQVQHMETDQAQNNNQAQKKSYQNYKFHTQKNIFEKNCSELRNQSNFNSVA
jgi:hypothetical protein